MVGEFIGTFLFLFFAFSATQVANAAAAGAGTEGGSITQVPNTSVLLYIALAFGFSLAVNAWVFFRISGGQSHPVINNTSLLADFLHQVSSIQQSHSAWHSLELSLGLVQDLSSSRRYLVAWQLLVWCKPSSLDQWQSPRHSVVTQASLAAFVSFHCSFLPPAFTNTYSVIEMFLTAELVFTIFMLAAEKHKGTFIAPIGIGLALFVAELTGVYFTGGSLNPARSFGPCVVLGIFPGYHWIYWLGPALGALVAVGFYRFVKMLEYETANPGADFNEHEQEMFDEHHDEENAATGADVARPNPATLTSNDDYRSGSMQSPVGIANRARMDGSHSEKIDEVPFHSGQGPYNAGPQVENGGVRY